MDPNAALTEMRQQVAYYHGNEHAPRDFDPLVLVDAVASLDEWLSKGGALPSAWAGVTPPGTPTERDAATQVRAFMVERGVTVLHLDDGNKTISRQRDFEDEDDLDDAVAWMPRSVISNQPNPGWNPVVTLADLDAYLEGK